MLLGLWDEEVFLEDTELRSQWGLTAPREYFEADEAAQSVP